ncbi:MAG: glycine dehydrogenase, partial [Ulvibacter sp.]
MNTDSFALRHIGPRNSDLPEMLSTINADSMEQLIFETIPSDIRLKNGLQLDPALSENEYLEHINELAS